jgi:hypothetical protein
MKKWIAAGVAVAGLTVFGGAAIAQNAQEQDPAQQQAPSQQQEQTRPDGRDGDCPWKNGGGQQDGQQQSSPETEV